MWALFSSSSRGENLVANFAMFFICVYRCDFYFDGIAKLSNNPLVVCCFWRRLFLRAHQNCWTYDASSIALESFIVKYATALFCFIKMYFHLCLL